MGFPITTIVYVIICLASTKAEVSITGVMLVLAFDIVLN